MACKPQLERQAMNSFSLFALMRQILGSLCQILLQPLRRWTKPDNHAPIPNAALDLTRSKSELMLENALLRQQLIVLQRQTKRPKLTWRDRALLRLAGQQAPCVETGSDHCPAGYPLALASRPVSSRMAAQVQVKAEERQKASHRAEHRADQAHGQGEPLLGRRAHSRRTAQTAD